MLVYLTVWVLTTGLFCNILVKYGMPNQSDNLEKQNARFMEFFLNAQLIQSKPLLGLSMFIGLTLSAMFWPYTLPRFIYNMVRFGVDARYKL